jgi:cell division protein FtsN
MPGHRPARRHPVVPPRLFLLIALLVGIAGCASQHPQFSATQEAAQYAARARHNYTPPGPPEDPWGPYITEAAARFDVPARWVRAVMRQESGGRLYEDGQLITSPVGAMGLMQVMPATFDELRVRYGLGDDPYDPHDNVLAGTAYIRELYDVYGSPAFLAAYNAGPGRLDDYLTRNRPLPDETRHYVARIAPNLGADQPNRISDGQMLAINQIPTDIPPGPRYPRHTRGPQPVALAENSRRISGYRRGEAQVLSLPDPPAPPPPRYAALEPPPHKSGFRLISRAMADTLPLRTGGPRTGEWAVQVGAFSSQTLAHGAAEAARAQAGGRVMVGAVQQNRTVLYRARVVGLSHEAAVQACGRIHGRNCIVLSPAAQG